MKYSYELRGVDHATTINTSISRELVSQYIVTKRYRYKATFIFLFSVNGKNDFYLNLLVDKKPTSRVTVSTPVFSERRVRA